MKRDLDAATRAPWWIKAATMVGLVIVVAPIVALLSDVAWTDISDHLRNPLVTEAVKVSVFTSLLSTALAAVIGIPMGWLLAKPELAGRNLLRSLATLPMVLPPVVAGVALLAAFGRRGVLGSPIHDVTGLSLPFTIWGVVAANLFVALPFVVVATEAGLESVDRSSEAVAATLGVSPTTTFFRVTLPAIRPALITGVATAWARSLGEFGATLTFAGSLAGRTQTIPLAVFVGLESDRPAALAMSALMIGVALIVGWIARSDFLGGSLTRR